MARNKKPRTVRKTGGKKEYIIVKSEDVEELMQTDVLLWSDEETEIYKTPCGTYRHNRKAGEIHIKSPILKQKLTTLAVNNSLQSDLDTIVQFEKLKVRHPKEPYLYQAVASAYKDVDRQKYEAELRKNYRRFPAYPRIALTYATKFAHEISDAELRLIVGHHTDIHRRFPAYKCFDRSTIINFLAIHNYLARKEKKYELALDCAESVGMFRQEEGLEMLLATRKEADPGFSRIYKILSTLFSLFLLGVFIAIIYGIVKFFQWIF